MKNQNPLFLLCFLCLFWFPNLPTLNALGSGATLTISYGNSTVCGIVAGATNHHIQCIKNNSIISIQPDTSYDIISGGQSFFCGLTSIAQALVCWDTDTFTPRRLYFNQTFPLREISVGDNQVCGIVNGTNQAYCWRGMKGFYNISFGDGEELSSISSGFGFSCGVLVNNSRNSSAVSGKIKCWGKNSTLAAKIQAQFQDHEMISVTAGGYHVCGFNSTGFLVCKGLNFSGQLNFPFDVKESSGFSTLSLGYDYSCAIRDFNGSIVCWGADGNYSSNLVKGFQFETIASGFNFTCGMIRSNFSVICWGKGWIGNGSLVSGDLPLPNILPGPCVTSDIECGQCGVVPGSQQLCYGSGVICDRCSVSSLLPPLSPVTPPTVDLPHQGPTAPSKGLKEGLLIFAILGSVGTFAGICTIAYCLYAGVCCGRKKVHNSVQPTIARGGSGGGGRNQSSNSPPLRSLSIRRQGSRAFRRQRSGTSSTKHVDRAEEFTFQELSVATDGFSLEHKIGAGSFGMVYRGKLADGREVAIKRGEINTKAKKFLEKETAFDSELAFLSRVHHKHLVRLVGYCEERDERLLVYEFMKNGALYDHLHDRKNVEKGDSYVNSWKVRIKIALDAARGIEYLHNYAVPPIIHRDIKSSNILLDANWTARVSDFGLSLMGPESERDYKPMKAAGTVGYIDPEYYGMNVLTAKSDVYGLGVVLLELLTGKRAIFKDVADDGNPASVVDFAVPAILAGELAKILDPRVGPPGANDSEALELVSYTALHCVHLEGKDRPSMTDIVGNLERALTLCDDSHGSISSVTLSIGSE